MDKDVNSRRRKIGLITIFTIGAIILIWGIIFFGQKTQKTEIINISSAEIGFTEYSRSAKALLVYDGKDHLAFAVDTPGLNENTFDTFITSIKQSPDLKNNVRRVYMLRFAGKITDELEAFGTLVEYTTDLYLSDGEHFHFDY